MRNPAAIPSDPTDLHGASTSRFRRYATLVASACVFVTVGLTAHVEAIEEASGAASPTIIQTTPPAVGSTPSVTIPFRSGVTATVTIAPNPTVEPAGRAGTWLSAGQPHSAYLATPDMFSPALDVANTPTVGMYVNSGVCQGRNFSGNCPGAGTMTITFNQPVTNPVLDISGLGGSANCVASSATPSSGQCNLMYSQTAASSGPLVVNSTGKFAAMSFESAQYDIQSAVGADGASPTTVTFGSASAGSTNLLVTPTTLRAANLKTYYRCSAPPGDNQTVNGDNGYIDSPAPVVRYQIGYGGTAGCGSVPLVGTFTSITFAVSANIVKNDSALGWMNGHNNNAGTNLQELLRISVRLNEDLGDAPASYDAGQAAFHYQGALQLGVGVTADAADVTNPTGNANSVTDGTDPDTDTDDAIGDGIHAPQAIAGSPYTLTIPVSGNTSASTLAGWIDWNDNHMFDAGERAGVAVPAGAPTADLTWNVPAGTAGTGRYLRLRLATDPADVASATGGAKTGEVEDYRLDIVEPAPAIEVVKSINGDDANTPPGVAVPAGLPMSITFLVRNTGNVLLHDVVLTDDVLTGIGDIVPDDPAWSGTLPVGGFATFTATIVASDLGGVLHTDTATVNGIDPFDTEVDDTDDANATTIAVPGISIVKTDGAGHDANTPASAVTLDPNGSTTIRLTITNTGNEPLLGIDVSDAVDGAGAVTGLECTFPDTSTGTAWPGPFAVGGHFDCIATLGALGYAATHADVATVTGAGAVSGRTVTSSDPYHASTPPAARIGDFVWSDLDGDGIQDPGEPGIGGVTVTLSGVDEFGHAVSMTTTTAADGSYHFDVPAGSYLVDFVTPSGSTPSPVGTGAGDVDSDGRSVGVVVGWGENNITIDSGFVPRPIEPPTTPPPAPTTAPTVPKPSSGGGLPITGVDAVAIGLLAVVLIGSGFVLLVGSRRGRRARSHAGG